MATVGLTNLAPENVTPGTNIIELINYDHRKFETLYQEYKSSVTAEQKQKIAWTMIREIAIHSAAEEMVMYPEVRKRLGDAAADELLSGHQSLKNKLQQINITTYDRDPSSYDTLVDETYIILTSHMNEEEKQFWPQFKALPGMGHQQLVRLGEKFRSSKHVAVTRPHPWAPNKPPLNLVANAFTAPLDALADQWRFALNAPSPQM